jgi:putative serine protease PepD
MTDDTNPMPDAPWWSQPGATAVLPPPIETAPPPAPERPHRRPRPGTAGLLALALVLGGGAGGAVASFIDDHSTPSAGQTVIDRSTLPSGASVAGNPESAAAIISPSVVTVEVTGPGNVFGGRQADTGSGIIIRSSGYVLTNNHVVAAAVGGGSVHVTLDDGKTVAASIVGTDPSIDLAVIRITGVSGLRAATFADSSKLHVGQAVMAVGAPLGLANTVTQGIVSTLHRPVRTGDSNSAQAVFDAVQTDAAINPGNSGGALVDLAGRVVGVNSAIASTGSSLGGQAGNIGVGFAIPSNTAVKIADQLIATGKASHAQIGVSVADAPSSTDGAPGLGATVQAVTPNGPAAKAGLKVGDVVTKVDDRRVTDANSMIVAVRSHDPGQTVTVTVRRGGSTVTLRVTLGAISS